MAQHYLPQVSLFTACVLFALLVSIPHGQSSCSLCQYKSVSTTTDITVFISNSTCSVLNATVTGTQSSITVTGLQPGYIYFLKINCTDMCCDNFTTNTYSNLTITQLNTTSVYLNWMGQNVLANQTVIMRPEPVSNLTVISTTVSSVTLSWVTSNGISPYYRVVWGTNTSFQLLTTTNQTSMHISQLQPGTKYIFNVTSLAPDNVTEGRSVQISQNTNPAQVENITLLNSNSGVNVSWAAPPGHVESYMVNISSAELNTLQSLPTSTNKAEFSNLTAGRIYNLTITSISGILKNVSVIKQFATKPNPPEALSVRGQTNESISLLWSKPLLMDGVIVSYEVSYRQSQSGVNQTLDQLTSLNVTLPNLSSGSQYNITVLTVGVSNLRSSYVNLTAYTAPNAVKSLAVSAVSTDSVNLTWDPPDGTPSLFSYSITAPNQTFNTSPTNYMINQLQPGTQYNCSVKTCINESICGPLQTIQCNTKPMPVISLIASRLGSTGMRLSWSSQGDYKSTYLYSVSVNEGQWNQSSNKTVDVFGLIPGTNYTFTVQTVANSISSEPVTISAYTGLDKASIISIVGTTMSLTVEWTPPSGNVTLYSIKIQQNRTVLKTENRTNVTPVVFSDLIPGSAYTVTVTSISGPIMTESDPVMNATFPTPPGELSVTARSMNYLSISWVRPINMSSVRHSFILQYSNNTLISASVNCSQNSSTLSGLSAGVQYNITVKTVGEMGYLSSPQQLTTYTNPSAVSDVMVNGSYEKIVSLSWQQLDLQQNGYIYLLAFTSNNTGMQITVYKPTAQLSLQSASTYNISIITQTAGNTKSDPRFITAYTKPFPVSSLRFEVFNVSTVKLSWSRPQEYHSGISYQILVSNCTKNTVNLSTTYENITVWDLQPGTLCQFSVSSSANGILGDPVNNSTLTKPSMANPRFPDQVSNDSLLVMWDHPNGELDRYILNISSEGGIKSVTLSNIQHNHTFTQLKAATVYTVMLTTVRGNFQATSSSISRATYPNRPGEIVELFKYTSSVLLRWAEAQNMTAGSFNYSLTYQQPGYNTSTLVTANNTFLLDNLRSGTSYNVSVATVGLMGFQSESVFRYPVTTKPDAVRDLTVVSTTVNAISIAWSGVDGVPKYVVSVHSEDGKLVKNTNTTTLSVDNLTASTKYNISVQSSTSDNTEGSAVWLSVCTDAAPLEHLVCKGPNLTEPMLSLTWSQPSGRYRAFEIKLSSSSSEETTQLNHNFTALKYNTQYTVYIWTLGCGAKSTRKEISCMTGITKPVVPQIQTAVEVTETQYNKFTVILKPEVFNDLNGPVLFYGVLVSTGNIDCTNQCVSNTYEDWKAGKCSAYLAVIKETELRKAADQTVVIGDQTVWKGYKNGELDAKGSYKFAVITFTRMELNKNGLVDESSYYSISQFCESSVILPENPVVIGAAAAGAAFAALLIVIIIGALVFKRKQRKDDSTSVPIHSIRNKVSDPIKVEDYEAYYRRQRADSFCGFAQEFEDLRPVGMNQPKTVATALENKAKNRYNNVLPYDPSRVKLSVLGSPFDDYINASYMPGYASKKEFIAAQGPLPCTVNDFWRMIWEKNVHTIVMLTKCNEQGRVKCEEYWPAEMKHFNNLTVTTISEIPLEDWTIRDFEVKNLKTAEARSVRHFHFTAWPDHGVPETTELLINFRHLVREHMDQYSRHSPTLVHCSAGVGRTGTFIAIDRLIFQIERDGVVDVYGIIHDLRMHRPLMVQTEDQYVFLNQCAMDIIRSRTGNNVDLIYQNTAALTIYENFEPLKKAKNGYHKA